MRQLAIALGVIPDDIGDPALTFALLEKLFRDDLGPDIPLSRNKAKAIAQSLFGSFPVIYAPTGALEALAARWRSQIAENAKTLSSTHHIPELCHNEIVGWQPIKPASGKTAVVMLRDRDAGKRIRLREDFMKRMLASRASSVSEVYADGKTALSKAFSLLYIGDYVSYYLAMLDRVDPYPVESIAQLKKELARR